MELAFRASLDLAPLACWGWNGPLAGGMFAGATYLWGRRRGLLCLSSLDESILLQGTLGHMKGACPHV